MNYKLNNLKVNPIFHPFLHFHKFQFFLDLFRNSLSETPQLLHDIFELMVLLLHADIVSFGHFAVKRIDLKLFPDLL